MLKVIIMFLSQFLGTFIQKKLFCKEDSTDSGGTGFIGTGIVAIIWLVCLIGSIVGLFSGNGSDLTTNLIMLGICVAVALLVFVLSKNAHKKANLKKEQ